MATGSSSLGLKSFTENRLQCGICIERYIKPKILDCFHSFCEKCLVKYYGNKQKMPCPLCRQEIQLPKDGVPGLKNNFYLEDLLEDVSSLLMKDGSSAKTPEAESICQKHKGEIKRFYCVTCTELICRDCTTIDHPENKGHHYIHYETAARERRQLIKDVFLEYKRDIKALDHSLALSSQAKQEFGKKVAGVMAEVHDRAEQIIAVVRREENHMIAELKTLERDRNNRFDEHEKTVTMMLQEKQSSLEVAEDVTHNCSVSDFLVLYPDIKLLTGQSVPQVDPNLSYLRFGQSVNDDDITLGTLELQVEGQWALRQEFDEFQEVPGIAIYPHEELAVADYRNKQVVIFSNEKPQERTTIPMAGKFRKTQIKHNNTCMVY